jgi:hypothetical protein
MVSSANGRSLCASPDEGNANLSKSPHHNTFSEQVSYRQTHAPHLTLFRYAGYGYNKDTLVCYKEDGTRLHVLSGSADLVSAIAVGSDGKMYSAHNRNVLMW